VNLVLAVLLLSATFRNGGALPLAAAAIPCGGENRSPELHWNDLPAATRSLALIVHDTDAPRAGGFYHWVAYNLSPAMRSFPPAAVIAPESSGRNDAGSLGYFGPCPPPGKPHHYHFTLYALDIARIDAAQPLSASELLARMRGHILAQSALVGLFATATR